MKVLLYFTLLGALVVLGVAISIPASPRDANRPQIATTEDIHDLPEGFTWDIVERPRGSDTRTKNPVSNADLQTDGLEKRAMGITCTGHSGSPPLWDDCHTLGNMIENYAATVLVQPGYCHETTYGSCLGYVCAKCRQVALETDVWARVHRAIIIHCVGSGEAGYANDDSNDLYEIGIEHSGDELPPYNC